MKSFFVQCPYCGEEDFDLPGLQFHLSLHCDEAKERQEAYEASRKAIEALTDEERETLRKWAESLPEES